MGYCIGYYTAVPLKNVWEIWPIKIDFDQPIVEIGQKMANGRLLFLALGL